MADTPPLSDRSDSKLQAVLNHDRSSRDEDLGAPYHGACKAWFARLTDREKEVAREAAEAFAGGHETRAEQIAAGLPPAPRFPLLHEDD
jgi:hypothetical protein